MAVIEQHEMQPQQLNPLTQSWSASKIAIALGELAVEMGEPLAEQRHLLMVQSLVNSGVDQNAIIQAINGWSLTGEKFFPKTSEIFHQAQLLAGEDFETQLAQGLAWTMDYLRWHGPEGKTRSACYRDEPGPDGRPVRKKYEDEIPAPQIPVLLEATYQLLGSGDTVRGLKFMRMHPEMRNWEDREVWEAKRIEEKFTQAYTRAQREVLSANRNRR